MMIEELELGTSDDNAINNAIVTFFAFALFGIVPSKSSNIMNSLVIPFIVASIAGLQDHLFLVSSLLTAAFLFILGVSKSLFSYAKWYWSGLETVFVGACSALASYLIGLAFEGMT